jgi:hypothetical protein
MGMESKIRKMDEKILYDQLILIESKKDIKDKVVFLDKEIPNYKIYYKGRSIGTLKEMIVNVDRKIKINEIRKDKTLYTLIIAHLIAQYIIKRIKRRDWEYANYLKQRRELIVEAIYREILKGPMEKFRFFGKVWTHNEILGAFIEYMGNRILDF